MSLELRDLRSFNVLKYGVHCMKKSYYTCVWEESLSEYDGIPSIDFSEVKKKCK